MVKSQIHIALVEHSYLTDLFKNVKGLLAIIELKLSKYTTCKDMFNLLPKMSQVTKIIR